MPWHGLRRFTACLHPRPPPLVPLPQVRRWTFQLHRALTALPLQAFTQLLLIARLALPPASPHELLLTFKTQLICHLLSEALLDSPR